MYNRVLVTGGAGFVGSSLALAIKRAFPQSTVMAFDNLRRRGSELNVARLESAGVLFVHGDVRAMADLTSLPSEADLILECSAEPSVLAGYGGSPEYLIHTNLIGCFHCLELARKTGADFLFISTSRVYPVNLLNQLCLIEEETRFSLAPEQTLPGVSVHGIREEFPLDGARSLYGMTKLAGELMIEEYAQAYGMRYIIDRCGLLTGPWQMGKYDQGVIVLWVASHYFERELTYIGFGGSGKQVRDFLHIDDFCELALDQIQHFSAYEGRRYNVGGGTACCLSLAETSDYCRRITGKTVPIRRSTEDRPADIPLYITDHQKVTAVRGWRPRRNAETTLTGIHHWIQSEEARLRPVLESQWGGPLRG